MIFINTLLKASLFEKVAMLLYIIGIKPNVTQFIDEETISMGYGKMIDDSGIWKFQIPFILTQPKIEDEYVESK